MSPASQEPGGSPEQPTQPQPYQPPSGQAQPYPPQQPYPGQAPYPGQPQPYPGQAPYPGQPHPYQGQVPYPGQPYPAQPYPGQPYGQSPYGQPGHPGAAYPTGLPHPATSAINAAKPKSPMVGIIGFSLVVITAIIGIVVGMSLAGPMAQIMPYLPRNPQVSDMAAVPTNLIEAATAPMTGLIFASLVGFVGWIISFVAAIGGRGRGWGVAGICLGVIAPFAILIAMSAALAGAI